MATVYVNNGSLGTFRSQLSMNVFTVSHSSTFSTEGSYCSHTPLEELPTFGLFAREYNKQVIYFYRIQSSCMPKMLPM